MISAHLGQREREKQKGRFQGARQFCATAEISNTKDGFRRNKGKVSPVLSV
jgi:hypothetical protein